MADPESTVYAADPHTKAKHQILEGYLTRWFIILSRQASNVRSNRRLLYVDGFAGAGEYENKIPGSPLVAIRAAIGAAHSTVPIQIKLIEKRADRVKHLAKLIDDARSGGLSASITIDDPIEGECEEKVLAMIDEEERMGRPLGPAFFFLDQFGYSSFSMSLVNRILKHDICEVFSYLNWNLLHPFMSDPTKRTGISRAFGGTEWEEVVSLHGQQKEDRFREIYVDALMHRGGAALVYPFAMRDDTNRVIYWLFFSTNNLRGLEEMKKAMWSVDRSGSFEFSDKFASSLGKLFSYGDDQLAADLHKTFAGKDVSVSDIERFVLVSTPAVNFKNALSQLQRSGKIRPVSGQKRKGEFSNPSTILHFLSDPVKTSLFE